MTAGNSRRAHSMGRVHGTHLTPTLSEVQARVDGWISQFEQGYWPPLSMLARLTEEVGELARELNHTYGHKPKKKSEPAGDIALEVADIIFVLVCLCNSLHIDLGTAFERVMQKYDRRDGSRWTRRAAPEPASAPARKGPAPKRAAPKRAAPKRAVAKRGGGRSARAALASRSPR